MSATAPPITDKYGIRSAIEWDAYCRASENEPLIEMFVPKRSLVVLAGDSGLGKSPLAYQMALCVAAGVPFLGRPVKQGRVLFCDYENGIHQIGQLLRSQSKHLGLPSLPADLRIWTPNDQNLVGVTRYDLNMIVEERPNLSIIDTFAAAFAESERKNDDARFLYGEFRKVIRKTGCSIAVLHHLSKPPKETVFGPVSLEGNPLQWFHRVRGAGSLVQGADMRLGVEAHDTDGLILAGYNRLTGAIPPTYLERAFDDEGEPIGYRTMKGAGLLFNKEMEEAFARLPETFRFKDARQTYGKSDQATNNWLKKCLSVGILRKTADGYEKVKVVE